MAKSLVWEFWSSGKLVVQIKDWEGETKIKPSMNYTTLAVKVNIWNLTASNWYIYSIWSLIKKKTIKPNKLEMLPNNTLFRNLLVIIFLIFQPYQYWQIKVQVRTRWNRSSASCNVSILIIKPSWHLLELPKKKERD